MKWKPVVLLVILLAVGSAYINTPGGITDWFLSPTPETLADPAADQGDARLKLGSSSVAVGDLRDDILIRFGDAKETLVSEYLFDWYIYPDDYKNYLQIGISESGVVQGLYTNSPGFAFEGLSIGSKLEDVRLTLGEPIDRIRKGNVTYLQTLDIDGQRERDLFLYHGQYVTVFYDIHKDTTVTAIMMIDEEAEEALKGFYGTPAAALKESFEKQNFYVTNAVRVREGLKPFEYNTVIAGVAEGHSRDMSERNYFSHETPDGKDVMDRALEGGLTPETVGENIAYGGQNGIIMHELLWNSIGHRNNILGNYQRMGVGVWFNDESVPYLTQNFYNPSRYIIGG